MSNITMEDAQELRKVGNYMVTNAAMTKVIGVFENKEDAVAGKKKPTDRIYNPLVMTKANVAEALKIHKELMSAKFTNGEWS